MKEIAGRVMLILCLIFVSAHAAAAQDKPSSKEVFTGTIVAIGGRTAGVSATFTLRIDEKTSAEDAKRLLSVLEDDKQEGLLKSIRKENLGTFSVGAQVGREINFVLESATGGKRRIFVVFERWLRFAEVRGGHRSEDYPFGVIELFIDEKGKGAGTFIAAARIKLKMDEESDKPTLEIENFGTFPAKLIGVRQRSRK
jgi:hypothetical protein